MHWWRLAVHFPTRKSEQSTSKKLWEENTEREGAMICIFPVADRAPPLYIKRSMPSTFVSPNSSLPQVASPATPSSPTRASPPRCRRATSSRVCRRGEGTSSTASGCGRRRRREGKRKRRIPVAGFPPNPSACLWTTSPRSTGTWQSSGGSSLSSPNRPTARYIKKIFLKNIN